MEQRFFYRIVWGVSAVAATKPTKPNTDEKQPHKILSQIVLGRAVELHTIGNNGRNTRHTGVRSTSELIGAETQGLEI